MYSATCSLGVISAGGRVLRRASSAIIARSTDAASRAYSIFVLAGKRVSKLE
jgi:hypothetical protein